MEKFKVLIVEDEMMIFLMIEDMLAEYGFQEVAGAATSKSAIALLSTGIFDVAILDINLGGLQSDEVAKALDVSSVPFVVISGNSIDQLPPEFREHPFLSKPFSYEDLIGKLEEITPKDSGKKSST